MTTVRAQVSSKERYFDFITRYPKTVLLLSLLVVAAFGFGIKYVAKDPSVDAFVPHDHPASLARDKAAELFGLEDPIVVGMVTRDGTSAFTAQNIAALRQIEQQVRLLNNVNKNGLISILSESAISAHNGDLVVEPIVTSGPQTNSSAQQAFQRLNTMPMMSGLLASKSGDTMTLIIPVNDANHATDTYLEVLAIAEAAVPTDLSVHVTGVASMNGRLAQMVNQDTRLFVPVAVITALILIFIALQSFRSLLGPLFVIAGSAAMAVGLMGWLGSHYYLITTALPVIIMAISIADSMHISTVFLHKCANEPSHSRRENLIATLKHSYLPVSLTTITTIAGFVGLALGSSMQPIAEFGWFAAAGVLAAWVLSLSALPAIILLSNLGVMNERQTFASRYVDKMVNGLTQGAFNRPWFTAGSLLAVTLVFSYFASQANFDYERQSYFRSDEKVRIADTTLNQHLEGLNFLDVVVSGQSEGDLMTPQAMQAIADLQHELSLQPHVVKTTSVSDYMALMHHVLTDAPQGQLPSAKNAPAQYMFLYESSGDPGDFSEEIDFTYQHALIRTQLASDRFSEVRPTVQQFNDIAQRWSATSGLEATVSGRVAVNTGWMALLAESHFTGLGLAVLFVFLASVLAFRDIPMALLSLIPILTGVLFTYALMGFLQIDIAPATSMTAAISTGLGVDFAIHLIWGIRSGLAKGLSPKEACRGNYLVIARACVFSAIALAVALGVICFSSAPPLQWFGALVSAAAVGSLVGAIVIIPALFALFYRPALVIDARGVA